jgi:GNAT superfamily N-acetyltransferase
MRVHPTFQHRGVGQAIYDRLEKAAAALGYNTLVLDTTFHKQAAQALYLKKGSPKWVAR